MVEAVFYIISDYLCNVKSQEAIIKQLGTNLINHHNLHVALKSGKKLYSIDT